MGRRGVFFGRLLGLGLVIVAPAGAARAGDPPALETAVKATFLYKFAPFVTWPNSAPAPGAHPFTICVVGADPFGPVLDRAVAGQLYGQSPYQITRMDTIGPQSPCDIAYLGGSRGQSVEAALRTLHGAPVLTVTDEGSPSGMIAFAVENGRVRFRIDQVEAQAAGLVISSKLLSLAVSFPLSGFPSNRPTVLLMFPLLIALAGTLDTLRCMKTRWSLYHGGVLLLLYMELMADAIILFFLLYPFWTEIASAN